MNKRKMTSVKETTPTVANIDDLANDDKEDLPF